MVYMPTILWTRLFDLRDNWRWAARCLIRIRRGEEPNTVFQWKPDVKHKTQDENSVDYETMCKYSETVFRISSMVAYRDMLLGEAITEEAKRISQATGQNVERTQEKLHDIYQRYGGPKRVKFLRNMRDNKGS